MEHPPTSPYENDLDIISQKEYEKALHHEDDFRLYGALASLEKEGKLSSEQENEYDELCYKLYQIDEHTLESSEKEKYKIIEQDIKEYFDVMFSADVTQWRARSIAKNLSFEKSVSLDKTMILLGFIKDAIGYADEPESLKKFLKKDITSRLDLSDNNYYLNQTAHVMIEHFDALQESLSTSAQPVRIGEYQYGLVVGDTLFVSDNTISSAHTIETLLKERSSIDLSVRLNKEESEDFYPTKQDENQVRFRDIDQHIIDLCTAQPFPIEEYTHTASPSQQKIERYLSVISGDLKNVFKESFGIDIYTLSIPEQFQLLTFLETATYEQGKAIESFSQKFGIDGFRSFLSLEQGGDELGATIIFLAEHLEEQDARKIFIKYSKLVDTIFLIGNFLKNTKGSFTPSFVIEKIKKNLLEKGVNLFKSASDIAIEGGDSGSVSKNLVDLLERYKENILLFASTFKTLSEADEEFSLEDIVGTQIEKLNKEEVEKYKEDIIAINRDNRKSFMSDEELERRTERLIETLKRDDTQFFGATFENKLISFVSFQEQQDGSLLAESLNVAPSIKQSHIGNAFFETLIKDLGKEKDIYGYVHKKNEDKLSFYKKLGFVTTPIIKDDGSEWYMIRYHASSTKEPSGSA